MVAITFLGIGAAHTATSDPVSFVIETDNHQHILVETPPSIASTLARVGYGAEDIDAVFISHAHGDRTLGYPYLMFLKHLMRLSKKGTEHVQILATTDIHTGLQAMLDFSYPPGSWGTFTIEAKEIASEGVLLDTVAYQTCAVEHSVPTQAIALTIDGKRIVYSSDTAYAASLAEFADGCDLLIHDAMVTANMAGFATATKHSTSTDAAKVAAQANAKQLMLVHLDATMMTDDKRQQLLAEAREVFTGEVLIPEPFERYTV